jgi:hypothetical protein
VDSFFAAREAGAFCAAFVAPEPDVFFVACVAFVAFVAFVVFFALAGADRPVERRAVLFVARFAVLRAAARPLLRPAVFLDADFFFALAGFFALFFLATAILLPVPPEGRIIQSGSCRGDTRIAS